MTHGKRTHNIEKRILAQAGILAKLVADKAYADIMALTTDILKMANGKNDDGLSYEQVQTVLTACIVAREMDGESGEQIRSTLDSLCEVEEQFMILADGFIELEELPTNQELAN
jgi:hypothetical protein